MWLWSYFSENVQKCTLQSLPLQLKIMAVNTNLSFSKFPAYNTSTLKWKAAMPPDKLGRIKDVFGNSKCQSEKGATQFTHTIPSYRARVWLLGGTLKVTLMQWIWELKNNSLSILVKSTRSQLHLQKMKGLLTAFAGFFVQIIPLDSETATGSQASINQTKEKKLFGDTIRNMVLKF